MDHAEFEAEKRLGHLDSGSDDSASTERTPPISDTAYHDMRSAQQRNQCVAPPPIPWRRRQPTAAAETDHVILVFGFILATNQALVPRTGLKPLAGDLQDSWFCFMILWCLTTKSWNEPPKGPQVRPLMRRESDLTPVLRTWAQLQWLKHQIVAFKDTAFNEEMEMFWSPVIYGDVSSFQVDCAPFLGNVHLRGACLRD